MNEIHLPVLKADSPICVMAAFGLLRVSSQISEFGKPRLHWLRSDGGYSAVLSTENPIASEQLLHSLVQHVEGMQQRHEWRWSEQIKDATRDVYVCAASNALDRVTPDLRAEVDWFSSFGSDRVVNDDGFLESTPFDMTVARQKFLADAVKLAESLTTAGGGPTHSATLAFREALFGPWTYKDDQHSLGWDPSATRLGAYSHKAPSEMRNCGVRAAVWLAMESLPLFPCFYARGNLRVRSFSQIGRDVHFCWPVWVSPVSLATLKSLLSLATITADQPNLMELGRRGVVAVYRSRRAKPNKYTVAFQPAVLVGSAPEHIVLSNERLGSDEKPGGARIP